MTPVPPMASRLAKWERTASLAAGGYLFHSPLRRQLNVRRLVVQQSSWRWRQLLSEELTAFLRPDPPTTLERMLSLDRHRSAAREFSRQRIGMLGRGAMRDGVCSGSRSGMVAGHDDERHSHNAAPKSSVG